MVLLNDKAPLACSLLYCRRAAKRDAFLSVRVLGPERESGSLEGTGGLASQTQRKPEKEGPRPTWNAAVLSEEEEEEEEEWCCTGNNSPLGAALWSTPGKGKSSSQGSGCSLNANTVKFAWCLSEAFEFL